ncbi:MAG: diacylglycerol kinase [Sulfurimonas sp.]
MRNQPKYSFFKNTNYALKGLKDMIKTEKSFKIELAVSVILLSVIFLLEVSLVHKLLMFMSLMGMLIAEAINSAIERTVDLVTLEHHNMAGRAKDAGSAVVFLSIAVLIITWTVILAGVL